MNDKAIRSAKLTAAGILDKARARTAVQRAGGQIAPSKYLPDVPRQVHADGGAANAPMFQGVHPDLQGEGGAPLDLYHGTPSNQEFEAFDNAKLGARDAGFYGRGHYLTPIKGNAEGYADPDEMGTGTVMGPLHAALKNPFVWDTSDAGSHRTLRDLQSMGVMRDRSELRPWDNLQRHEIGQFMGHMKQRGHDGVVMKTDNGISEVVAFDPKTIKHRDAEVFDPNDPRIRREAGGRAGKAVGGGFGYVPQAALPQLRLAVAQPLPQAQPKGGSWLNTLTDLAVAAKKPEGAAAPVAGFGATMPPSSTSGPTSGAAPQTGNMSGFYAPFKSDLDRLIAEAPGAVTLTSGYRTPERQQELWDQHAAKYPDPEVRDNYVARPGSSSHNYGLAADLSFASPEVQQWVHDNAAKYNLQFRMDHEGWHIEPINLWELREQIGPPAGYADGGSVGNEGIDAYHGSPHDFDQFDISKLGTGEGAQAYGHGLYFAGNENVAKAYRDQLSNRNETHLISSLQNAGVSDDVGKSYASFSSATRGGKGSVDDFAQSLSEKHPSPVINAWRQNALNEIPLIKNATKNMSGHMYKVKLNIGQHELLDWDRPLSKQHPNVQAALARIDPDQWHPTGGDYDPSEQGQMAYQRLVSSGNKQGAIGEHLRAGNPMKRGDKWASEALMAQGIKGIRYRDAGSRGDDKDGDPTHNYVMFHHDPVKVADKYAYGGEVENMEQPANGMHMLRMRRAGINTKDDFWNRWSDYMKAKAGPDTRLSQTGGNKSKSDRVDSLLMQHRQVADTTGIRNVFSRYGSDLENGHMAAAMPRAILQKAGIEPTVDNASAIYHSLPDDESGRLGFNEGGEVEKAPTAYSQTGTQALGLPGSGGVRGSQGVLPAPAQTSGEEDLTGLPKSVKMPKLGQTITAAHDPRIRQVSRDYAQQSGIQYNPPTTYQKVDPARAKRIADAYEAMPHEPNHPLVKASYEALLSETKGQYEAMKRAGVNLEFYPDPNDDPYKSNPRLAVEDVKHNNHMYIYPTDAGYGSGDALSGADENPLLRDSGERWHGKPVLFNDLFRAVHDYFGHAKEGVGFRADGEENAWRQHAAMFSPLARIALGSETRGQNSWLNYGPHGDKNRTAATEDTVFADQKLGVLPHWVHHEGAEDFIQPHERKQMEDIYRAYGKLDESPQWSESEFTPDKFSSALKSSPFSSTLTQYDPSEVREMINKKKFSGYKLAGKDAYFGIKHGADYVKDYGFEHPALTGSENALVGVVNNDKNARGVGDSLMKEAIKRGVTALDAFAVPSDKHPRGFLADFYGKHGFKELGRVPFDPKYVTPEQLSDMKRIWAKSGWDEKRHPFPDVVIMKRSTGGSVTGKHRLTQEFSTGGAAKLMKAHKVNPVDTALSLTRRFTKDGKAATMALKPKGK